MSYLQCGSYEVVGVSLYHVQSEFLRFFFRAWHCREVDAPQYLGQFEFQATVGPARVAYLIAPRSDTGFRRAVSEACTRWGGKTEPIVQVHTNGRTDPFSKKVLQYAAIDSLVNVDADQASADSLSSKLGLSYTNLVDIDQQGRGQFTCHPDAVAPVTGMNLATFAAPSLDLWAIAAAGTFTQEMIADRRANPGLVRQSGDEYEILRGELWRTNAIDVTCEQFSEWFVMPPPTFRSTVIWICSRRQFFDCVNFWNFRALQLLSFDRGNVMLLGEYNSHHWLGLDKQIRGLIENRPNEFDPDVVLFSLSTPKSKLKEMAANWGLTESSNPVRSTQRSEPAPPRREPFTYRIDIDPRTDVCYQRHYGMMNRFQVQAWQGPIKLHFPSPVTFLSPGRVKLGIGSNLFNRLPKRESVAKLIIKNSKWTGPSVEVFTASLNEYRVDLLMPLMKDVVRAVASDTSVASSLSDKGKLAESIARRFDISELLRPGHFEAIQFLTTRRSSYRSESRTERRVLLASQLENVPISSRAAVSESLVSQGFAERGLCIKCVDCGITSFILLDETTQNARCPGCYQPQKYELQNGTIATYYRLNSLIDRASDQGAILHLLAMAVLRTEDEESYVRPGMNFVFKEDTRRETDLFGVFRGRVISGEVKPKTEGFSELQIRKDLELSTKLEVDTHIMACFGKLDQTQVELASSISEKMGLELMVLDLNARRSDRLSLE